MALQTLQTSDAGYTLPGGGNAWSGGNAPGGVLPPNPAVAWQPVTGPIHTETIQNASPPLYGGPSGAPIPFVPGKPQAPTGGGINPVPPIAVDTGCDSCSAPQTPGAGGVTMVAPGQTQPVLKTVESGCAICDKLKALAPWWLWVLALAVVLYLFNRK